MSASPSARLLRVLLVALLPLSGCGGGSDTISNGPAAASRPEPVAGRSISLRIAVPRAASRAAKDIASVSVSVSGPGIDKPLSASLSLNQEGTAWEGTLVVPVGVQRVFEVVAKDAAGQVLYVGRNSMNVEPGGSNALSIELHRPEPEEPKDGSVDLVATIADSFRGIGPIGVNVGPYTKPGQDPRLGTVVTKEHLEQLYALTVGRCHTVRTYSCTNGNEEAPRIAKRHGQYTYVGIWLDGDDATNQEEIANALKLVAEGVVDCLVVGSEVLLRGDLTESQLIAYIDQVKQQVSVPVAYADTWNVWLQDRSRLAESVSRLMINIFPYWESVSIDEALSSIDTNWAKVTAAFPDRVNDCVLGEAGWPTSGTVRGDAVPSPENAQRFVLELSQWAEENDVPVLHFELAFEPWKSAESVEWGFFRWDSATGAYVLRDEMKAIWF